MPVKVPVGPEPHDFRADAREFWQGIRDGVDPAQLTAIQERLKVHCPSVDAFSFEVVDEEGAPAGELGTSPRTLEPGTPKNAVDAWNSAKLVALTKVLSAEVCGAAIGTVKAGAQDFKACCVSKVDCEYGNHKSKSVVRIPFTPDYSIRIAAPSTTGAVTQVLSRPCLTSADFVYMPPDSDGFKRLMELRFEPRVWKMLLDYFPGAASLLSVNAPALKPAPPTMKSESPARSTRSASGRLVTDAPIFSPSGPSGLLSRQLPEDELRWSDVDDDESAKKDQRPFPFGDSIPPSKEPPSSIPPVASVNLPLPKPVRSRDDVPSSRQSLESPAPFSWQKMFAKAEEEENPADDVSEISAGFKDSKAAANYILALDSRLKNLEERERLKDKALQSTFEDLSKLTKALQKDLKRANEEISKLKTRGVQTSSTPVSLLDWDLTRVAKQVLKLIKSEAGLARVSDIPSIPEDLSSTLSTINNELYHSAGVVPRLLHRVEILEASRSSTAIEMGGHVFTDEPAVDAWLRTLNDPNAYRFCADFLALFLLAEPKYETIEQGLDKTAAVKKAQFASLDIATIDLSYKMTYPPKILKFSDKEAAQENGGVEWSPSFVSHSAFDGTYNNGTHHNLEKAIKGVVRAWESGIDVAYPVRTHPKPNAVFKAQLHLAGEQCFEYLNSLTPLFKQISGGITDKEAWARGLVFTKQVFDDVAKVRTINSEATMGSKVWASFRTTEMLKSYQLHEWVEHPKASSILALTSIRKEGKIVAETVSKLKDQSSTIVKHTGEIKALKDDVKALKQKNPSLA
jgi:hypothetical protein